MFSNEVFEKLVKYLGAENSALIKEALECGCKSASTVRDYVNAHQFTFDVEADFEDDLDDNYEDTDNGDGDNEEATAVANAVAFDFGARLVHTPYVEGRTVIEYCSALNLPLQNNSLIYSGVTKAIVEPTHTPVAGETINITGPKFNG